jgi:hypothetical protein
MANIQKLTYPYFTDGTTQLNAANFNPIIAKINEVIDKVNRGVTPTIEPVVPTITLNTTAKTVALSATSGLTIKYSTNGGTPTTTYSSPINVASGATIKAISTNGSQSSSVPKITVKYNESGGTIEFATSETGTIRYTTDGSSPTSGSTAYSSAITPVAGTTYKVAVYNGSTLASEIASIVIPS